MATQVGYFRLADVCDGTDSRWVDYAKPWMLVAVLYGRSPASRTTRRGRRVTHTIQGGIRWECVRVQRVVLLEVAEVRAERAVSARDAGSFSTNSSGISAIRFA